MTALRKAGMEAVDVRNFPTHPYQKVLKDQVPCYFEGKPDKLLSLVFVTSKTHVLLGKKKRGFGKDKFNGFGGKMQSNDKSIEDCAVSVHHSLTHTIEPSKYIEHHVKGT